MFDFVEPRVRRLVADHLGVGTEELTRDVSLADELAVDSLDLVELALALETEFGISMSEATLSSAPIARESRSSGRGSSFRMVTGASCSGPDGLHRTPQRRSPRTRSAEVVARASR